MTYRGFSIVERGRGAYLAERPLPGEKAIYRIAGKTLKELQDKIDWWCFDFVVGVVEI